jgi:hypothetical protein
MTLGSFLFIPFVDPKYKLTAKSQRGAACFRISLIELFWDA